MNELQYIYEKFNLDPRVKKIPVEIPNVRRDDLAKLFNDLGYKTGVEVGVKEGDYSVVLCESITGLHLHSIDPWTVGGEIGTHDRHNYNDGRPQSVFDQFEATARERLAPYNCTILKMISEEAVKLFDESSLDFVYIDGHHDFINVAHDLYEWGRRIRPGGIISGHDYAYYRKQSNIHVHEVVDAWTRAYRIKPWFILGLKERTQGLYRDKYRSFFWVKE